MYEILSSLKDCLQTCFDPDSNCAYQFFVSLGIPPAECNSIAVWLESSQRARSDNSECCTSIFNTDINITLTRCCGEREVFDPKAEDKDAECFLNDLCRLRDCLSCGSCVLADYDLGCGGLISEVRMDMEKQGGCYSATLTLGITEDCCGQS